MLRADVSLSPGTLGLQPQDLWAIVTARGPGLGTQHLAVIAGDYPSTSKHTLHTIHRISLATPKAALAVFAANSSASSISSAKDWPHSACPLDGMLHLSVHNAKASMVGGFVCPCSGAQAGQAVPVAVMGVQHADGSLGMQLLELDLAAGESCVVTTIKGVHGLVLA